MSVRIGVYICHCGSNIAGKVDPIAVSDFAQQLQNVIISRHYQYMCSEPGQQLIINDIKEHDLNRIVVAACSPLMHEQTFRSVLRLAGLNPFLLQIANIREHCSWVTQDPNEATEKAKVLVSGSVGRARFLIPLKQTYVTVNKSILVIGGGIAGIQAALKCADTGYKVYLVEKTGSIGGHMAMLDKTFPTLDCSACILTPKMVQVGQHPNIKLLTLSEVQELAGTAGNFKVKIKKKARYITDKCTGCSECVKVCPIEVPSEFELGLVRRKAIYRNFPQAVPNTFAITRDGYPPCKIACPIGQDVQGYLLLTAKGMFKEAHELIRKTNALPSVCGRVCYHPCEASCKRNYIEESIAIRNIKRYVTEKHPTEEVQLKKEEPTGKKIAIVGSGPSGLTCAHDLALMGHDVTIYEKHAKPGGMLVTGIPEFRLPRDILDRDINFIKNLGVKIEVNSPIGAKIKLSDLKKDFDAVYVAIGAHKSMKLGLPNEDAKGIIHGVDFLRKINLGEEVTIGDKVIIIGGGNTAIDSARVALRLGSKDVKIVYRRTINEMPASMEEIEAAKEEGVEIVFLAAPKQIIADGDRLNKVVFAKMRLGEPDESGRRRPVEIEGKDFTLEVDTLLPAVSQSPEVEFLDEEKLEVTKWDTIVVNDTHLSSTVEGIFAGGDVVSGPATVVEAMGMGKRAAIAIHNYTLGKPLDEGMDIFDKGEVLQLSDDEITALKKENEYKNKYRQKEINPDLRKTTFNEVEQTFTDEEAKAEAERCLHCTVCAICRECEKVCDFNAIDYDMKDEILEVEAGNVIVTTGFKIFDPKRIEQFGYGRYPNVFTSLEFERIVNASGPTDGNIVLKSKDENGRWTVTPDGDKPGSVALIHCVGSRDENYNKYCSKVCCMYSLKLAHLVKEKLPDAEVFEYFIDMRAFGKGYEEFYDRIMEEGVHIIRGRTAKVEESNGQLLLRSEDIFNDKLIEQKADMVILSVGLESREDSVELSKMLGISINDEGWMIEANSNSDPVNTFTGGIAIAGVCQGPKDIPDTVAQASAAASRVMQSILKGKIKQSIKDLSLENIESQVKKLSNT